MPYFHSHIQTAVKILEAFKGEMPFAAFLKNYFSKEKKYGSKDRKQIGALCYYYFRTGKSLQQFSTTDKILAGILLGETQPNSILAALKPEWNAVIESSIEEKFQLLKINQGEIFSFREQLSGGIDRRIFEVSFLQQPKLFIRVRPRREVNVFQKLGAAEVTYEKLNDQCLAFDTRTKVDAVLKVNEEYVVQDYNSQRVGEFIALARNYYNSKTQKSPTINVWDCCAASGGKSILAHDTLPDLHLAVSDIRKSIVHNLQNRFQQAGIKNYQSFIADLTQPQPHIAHSPFDLIICDAPCSGSGTWGRTPEQLVYFKPAEVEKYTNLQKQISLNAIRHVKPGGHFLYITCSVFAKENEDVVQYILKQADLKLLKAELLNGYEMHADTMFAALFEKA
jgi:16S rRNA (cytosine967-C5)-methyltransferase